MEFRKYATRETSALVGRLVTSASEKVAGDLQAVRQAVDVIAGAVDQALARQADPEYRDEVASLAERLADEAARRTEASTEEVRKEAKASLDRLTDDLEARVAENRRLAAVLAEAQEQANALQADLDARTREMDAAVDAARQATDEHERMMRSLQSRLDAASAAASAFRQRAETAERETNRVRSDAELAAQASVRAARALEEAEARASARLGAQADAMRQHAAAFLSVSLDRLLAMYLTVASSATIDEVLAAVVEALAVQFSRVALFRVQANHLEGVRQVGFDLGEDISQVLMPRSLDSLLTHAAASGHIETRSGAQLADSGGTPFGGSPECALAVPIVVDGQPLAVVYADDSDQPHREFALSDVRLKFAQLLQCHAVPLLTRLAAEAKAVAELDEYAALLLNELEHTYAADLNAAAAVPDAERQRHLRDNIEYAWRLYGQRASSEGPRAAALFEQRLLALVETRGATPFGRDVASVIGEILEPAEAADRRQSAGETAGNRAS